MAFNLRLFKAVAGVTAGVTAGLLGFAKMATREGSIAAMAPIEEQHVLGVPQFDGFTNETIQTVFTAEPTATAYIPTMTAAPTVVVVETTTLHLPPTTPAGPPSPATGSSLLRLLLHLVQELVGALEHLPSESLVAILASVVAFLCQSYRRILGRVFGYLEALRPVNRLGNWYARRRYYERHQWELEQDKVVDRRRIERLNLELVECQHSADATRHELEATKARERQLERTNAQLNQAWVEERLDWNKTAQEMAQQHFDRLVAEERAAMEQRERHVEDEKRRLKPFERFHQDQLEHTKAWKQTVQQLRKDLAEQKQESQSNKDLYDDLLKAEEAQAKTIRAQKQKLQGLLASNAKLQRAKVNLQQTKVDLQLTKAKAKRENARLRQEASQSDGRVSQLQQDNANLQQQLFESKAQVSQLQQSNDVLQQKLIKSNGQIAQLQQANASLQQELAKSRAQASQLQKSNAGLQQEMSQSKETISQLQQDAERASEAAYSTIEALEKEIANEKKEASNALADKITLDNTYEQLLQVHLEALDEVKSLHGEVKTQDATIQSLTQARKNDQAVIDVLWKEIHTSPDNCRFENLTKQHSTLLRRVDAAMPALRAWSWNQFPVNDPHVNALVRSIREYDQARGTAHGPVVLRSSPVRPPVAPGACLAVQSFSASPSSSLSSSPSASSTSSGSQPQPSRQSQAMPAAKQEERPDIAASVEALLDEYRDPQPEVGLDSASTPFNFQSLAPPQMPNQPTSLAELFRTAQDDLEMSDLQEPSQDVDMAEADESCPQVHGPTSAHSDSHGKKRRADEEPEITTSRIHGPRFFKPLPKRRTTQRCSPLAQTAQTPAFAQWQSPAEVCTGLARSESLDEDVEMGDAL